jgi:hypothetical protein
MSRRQRRLHKQLIRKQEAERRAAEEAARRSGAGGADAQNESDDEESVEVSVDDGAGHDADAAKQDSDDEGPLVDEEYGKEELPSGVLPARWGNFPTPHAPCADEQIRSARGEFVSAISDRMKDEDKVDFVIEQRRYAPSSSPLPPPPCRGAQCGPRAACAICTRSASASSRRSYTRRVRPARADRWPR